MTSFVLDLTTIAAALQTLCDDFFFPDEWHGSTDAQREFLDWYAAHRDEIRKLDSLESLASTSYEKLNAFLTQRGFDAMFEELSEDGIGVAAILDMLVTWAKGGIQTSLARLEPGSERDTYGRRKDTWVRYPAFEIEPEGVQFYEMTHFAQPLVQLHTTSGHSLWLMKTGRPPAHGIDLCRLAHKVLTGADRRPATAPQYHHGVVVPMLDFDLRADLDWLLGVESRGPGGHYAIDGAFQQFKLRANDEGARVKVATGLMVASAACGPITQPYTFDDPFIGFFTQPGHDHLPLAAFYADTDVWKEPAGSLEEL